MGQCSSTSNRFFGKACQWTESEMLSEPSSSQLSDPEEVLLSPASPHRNLIKKDLSAGDTQNATKPNPDDMDFLELFDDEVKVLSGLANLEMDLLKGNSVAVGRDDLICLLMQESHRLAEEQRIARRNCLQNCNDRGSLTSMDGLRLVTKLLLRLQNSGGDVSRERQHCRKTESSIDSGLDEDVHASIASAVEYSASATLEGKNECEPGKILGFNEEEGKEVILQGFLDDLEKFDGVGIENDAEVCLKRFPPPTTVLSGLRRNKMSLHLFGTSRLHEELKLRPMTTKTRVCGHQNQRQSQCSSTRLPYYPVHYKFWTLMDETLLKCFNNNMDRRILATCRRSHCLVQLLTPVRKNANGISVQQISIQAPSLGALERCCSILDDVFPQFNASITLRGRGSSNTTTIESKAGEVGIEEATVTVSGMSPVLAGGAVVEMATEQHADSGRCPRYRGISRSSASFTSSTAVHRHRHPACKHKGEGLIGYIISEMKKNEGQVAAEAY
ncbi:hypothetical protein ECG_00690 [Echinococcus granulosus]|uniref:Uncharacterized protein n=1 Tax=Echinococcus granulosus TaxID=6210 RepID=W6UVK8_ECHGR|nr:hypothetical protein EGR_00626 [Echinococcus granulosus]EUB64676.1 hypothetical protein EGR_00626 [Echinococcus granulosus]KAH9285345.1 hypothetical protein ECG_00690 [Echinococcus granulosus]